MMNSLQKSADLLGRILLVVLFLPSGIGKILDYSGTIAYMATAGVPGFVLPLVILTEVGGSIAILLGWHTRIAAFLMGGFTLLAVLIFHHNPADHAEKIIALAEIAVAGGLLVLCAHGAGPWSVDARRQCDSRTAPLKEDAGKGSMQ